MLALLFLTSLAYGQGNPAAQHCVNTGGVGSLGLCSFGESIIESWTLFKFTHGQPQKAVAEFCKSKEGKPTSSGEIPGPQITFCRSVGGALYQLGAVSLCEFKDHSQIELHTLFLGPRDEQNTELNKILCCLFVEGC